MNKNEYMRELERALGRLPREDRREALSYYREYFDDAGPLGEQDAIREFGSPKEVAAQILKDVAVKRLEAADKLGKRRISTIWIVLLALFAAPVGLPLLGACVVVLLAIFVTVFAVLASLLFTGVFVVITGAFTAFAGFYFLPAQPSNGIFILGTAFLQVGVGIFFICGCVGAWKGTYFLTKRGIKKRLMKGDGKS